MQPGTDVGNPSEFAPPIETGEFTAWLALQQATDPKRANLIADIVGHPAGAITVEELDYLNPPMSDDAIRRHLQKLIDVQVVEVSEYPPGERSRKYPYKFYSLTTEARALFDDAGLFPEAAWQRQYQSVEKTDRIREVETLNRP